MRSGRGWKGVAREATARALRYSGVPYAIRRTGARDAATILLYHDPPADLLEQHLRYLAGHYRFTTLDVVVDAIASGDWSQVPERAAVLTIDDGHRGNHALLPLFRRFGVRPTIYLCSQIVGTERRFWFQEPAATQDLKRLSNRERLEALKRLTGFEQERAYPGEPRQALSRDEILEMAPWVDFGAHTRFHPILPQCEDAEAWQEIAGSKRDLEALLGREIRHFSYPNGDYTAREIEYARRAGFASARTTDVGWTGRTSDPFRLAMMGITDDASVDMLTVQLTGIVSSVRRLVRRDRSAVIAPSAP